MTLHNYMYNDGAHQRATEFMINSKILNQRYTSGVTARVHIKVSINGAQKRPDESILILLQLTQLSTCGDYCHRGSRQHVLIIENYVDTTFHKLVSTVPGAADRPSPVQLRNKLEPRGIMIIESI